MSDASNTAQLPGILGNLTDVVGKGKAIVKLKDIEVNFSAFKENDVLVPVNSILSSRNERSSGLLCQLLPQEAIL